MDELGKLYIVATPIGNLEDITLRALRILKEVSLIACEDTRVTRKLLSYYSISTQTISFHQHSDTDKIEKLVEQLKEGKDIALVTDAGTPGVSDPGNKLVEAAFEAEIVVVPIPGASALASIISVAGIDMQQFCFLGFPPHKKGRETYFKKVAASDIPVMYYESPHRVLKNLELLKELLEVKPPIGGLTSKDTSKKKKIILGRELTKMFEQILRGSIEDTMQYFQENPSKIKGEFVIIVY